MVNSSQSMVSSRTGENEPGLDRRPRLLFLCQTLPFPPDGGVHIRTYHVMRLLARAFDITALCFYRKATRPNAAVVSFGISGLSEFAHVEAFPIPQEYNRARLLWDHLRSSITRTTYTRFVYDSKDFRARVEELLGNESFDLIHLDSLDLAAYLPLTAGNRVICTHHNVESALLRRRAQTESSLLRRYLAFQAGLMRAEEARWCDKVSLNVMVSGEDARTLREIAPRARTAIVPNGVDTTGFQPSREHGEGVVFVGGYSWYPNRDAMAYFATDILPLLRRTNADVRLTWVGRAPEHVRSEYLEKHGIALTGYVEDIRPHVQSAACFVVPLRVGGGTRLKILDAWAMGMPVVSTSVGCEGLEARDGENILIRDDPAEFAAAIRTLLADVELRQRLSHGARVTAERVYDWDVIGKTMISDYLAVAQRSDPRVAL